MAKQRGAEQQLGLFGPGPPPVETARPAATRARGVAPAVVADDVTAIARHVPASVYLGTSSWSFPGWAGLVYAETASKERLARSGLAAYAEHPLLRAVGIDRTYYAPIRAQAFAAYAAAVPAEFRFLVKAHERCTMARFTNHPRYGAQRGTDNDLFLHAGYAADAVVGPAVDGLGEKAAVVLFQFPPQGLAGMGGAAGFAERLHAFLAALPGGPVYAVEVRNPHVLTPQYADALRDAGASHCFNVHPSMPPIDDQERQLAEVPMPATVVRWMLASHLDYEAARERYQPFDRIVDEDPQARRAIARLCLRAAGGGQRSFVIINNKAEGSAPLSAVGLGRAIADACDRP